MARAARLRRHRHPAARARPARRPRRRAARRARPGQDPAAAHPGRPARRVDAGHRGLRARRAPLRADHARRRSAAPPSWATTCRSSGGTATSGTPRSSPPRTPRVADLIGDVDPMKVAEGRCARRPRDHPLRPDPAQPPRHRRDQRAARPRRADPGRDAQRDGGARHPDPRLRAAAAARRAGRRQRQPRGLHQPRPDHHAAQGPVRRRDPHPLPDASSTTRSPSSGRRPHLVADVPDHLVEILARFTRALRESQRGRPALRRLRPVRHRRRRDGRGGGAAPGDRPGRGRGGRPGRRPRDRASTCSAARSSSRPARRAASARSSTTCCARPPPRPCAQHLRGSTSRLLVDAHRGRRDGHAPASRSPRATSSPGCRCSASPSSTTRSATGSARPTTASGPAPSSSRSRASTSPARSARSTGGGETVYG